MGGELIALQGVSCVYSVVMCFLLSAMKFKVFLLSIS